MRQEFKILTKEDVSEKNSVLFGQLEKSIGKVPNLYSVFAYSANALGNYLQLEGGKTSLIQKEIEAINLVVSEVNQCVYCLSAHTIIAKQAGFTQAETIEIRSGSLVVDSKLDALVKFAKVTTEQRGHISGEALDAFFDAGYTKENLIDVVMLIGDRTISNIVHALTGVPVDFPVVKPLEK